MTGRIIICPPTNQSIRKISSTFGMANFKWVYLGENVLTCLSVEKQIDCSGEKISISELLQETAELLRQPYIDYIGELSVEKNSILWWMSSLSEKTPFISKTFLYFCYIKVVFSLIDSYNRENIVFFVENRALSLSLYKNMQFKAKTNVTHIKPASESVIQLLNDWKTFILKHGWFVLSNMYRIVLTKYIYRLNNVSIPETKTPLTKDISLIYTWVDKRAFTEDGSFRDAYFGNLSSYMQEKGKHVYIVPSILHTVSFKETVKRLTVCKEKFLFPSAYLKISDIFHVLKITASIPKKEKFPYFEDIDVSEIIQLDCTNDWKDTRVASNLLIHYLVKNWNEQGLPIERFIYPYENHIWEKMYCMALKTFYSNSRIIGHQHSTISKMMLNNFFSKREVEIIPFPDMLITNGKHTEKLFLSSGYDPDKLICGGAVRYEYLLALLKQKDLQEKKTRDVLTILVTPSANKNESSELILKCLNSLGSLDFCSVILKCHPLLPYEKIADNIGVSSLPSNFKISDQLVNVLLKESDLLIYTHSTTCIEALAFGTPALHIASDFVIDSDRLDSRPDIRLSSRTNEEIQNIVRELFEMDSEELSRNKMAAKEVVTDFFGIVDDSVFELFVKN